MLDMDIKALPTGALEWCKMITVSCKCIHIYVCICMHMCQCMSVYLCLCLSVSVFLSLSSSCPVSRILTLTLTIYLFIYIFLYCKTPHQFCLTICKYVILQTQSALDHGLSSWWKCGFKFTVCINLCRVTVWWMGLHIWGFMWFLGITCH